MCKKSKIEIDLLSIYTQEFSNFGWVLAKPNNDPNIETDNIRLWHSVAPMDGFKEKQTISYFETKKVPIECDELECVFFDDEAYINTGSSRLVIFVASSKANDNFKLDESTIKAFLIPPGVTIIIKKGVWHWAPYPIDHDNSFLLMLANRVFECNKEELWVNDDYVVFKKLENIYTINIK